ncbi:MinD/ParA family protein [Pseudomonadales bacterium]|jgi:flagellar biosynthesis protein FlhG|nr:MinD/ParA family protein [Gammaproteobacteria bacterium]MDA7717914.1 MinD/ParA family protein [Pseudomonadales bacterium]MDC3304757.1 MinD/ParA family protein [bacterium]MDA8535310.1 MinD/ParA family protein [Pseudomonadales bacterium]MDA9282548.1 MinD/ParA family protein [Pseudomonadales bacterium]
MPDPVRVIAVTSGKGGVGKTNISVNLAASLSLAGQRVMLMDADLGLANVDVLLGLEPHFDLQHVISGEKSLDEIIVQGPLGIHVVPASSGVEKMAELTSVEHASLIAAFSELKQPIDVLIVDTAAGIADGVVSFAKACQEVIVVVCDEPTSLTDAYALIKVLSMRHGIKQFQILANMVKDESQGLNLYEKLLNTTDRFLEVGLKYLGAVPFDEQLRQSVRAQKPVIEAYPRSPAAKALVRIGEKINRWPLPDQATGYLQFFVERLLAAAGSTAKPVAAD